MQESCSLQSVSDLVTRLECNEQLRNKPRCLASRSLRQLAAEEPGATNLVGHMATEYNQHPLLHRCVEKHSSSSQPGLLPLPLTVNASWSAAISTFSCNLWHFTMCI